MIGSITLENLTFFANHGFYAEEQKIGNKYSVSLTVETNFSNDALQKDLLHGTIDYGQLYKIVAAIMATPTKLLEHIAFQILETTLRSSEDVLSATVIVSKHNPPIAGLCEKSTISLQMTRAQLENI